MHQLEQAVVVRKSGKMGRPLAAFAIALMICGRSNACSSLYHSDSSATPPRAKERLIFPTMATTRITGVTFAVLETTTEPYKGCSADPCDRGNFCSRHNSCHPMEDACYIGELPPYRLCHDFSNSWCRFEIEPKDKTACGMLHPKNLDRLGWSITEEAGAYQERLKQMRRQQELQMKQMCHLSPLKTEGWVRWCGQQAQD